MPLSLAVRAFILILIVLAGGAFFLWVSPSSETPEREPEMIYLYYYNPQKDTDKEGNILCSRGGLVSVTRILPASASEQWEAAVQLLLEGDIYPIEREAGMTTEFPLEGLSLQEAGLENGALVLSFKDLQGKTTGGACRTSVLRFQIEETVLQFPDVHEVLFYPEDVFQP